MAAVKKQQNIHARYTYQWSDYIGGKCPFSLFITDRLIPMMYYRWLLILYATSEDFGVGRNNRRVNGGRVRRWMLVLSMLLEVHRWNEALRALNALIASLHQVNLWLGVSVQVRLGHALVVAQPTHVLADSCITQHQHQQAYIRLELCFCQWLHHYLVKSDSAAKLQ